MDIFDGHVHVYPSMKLEEILNPMDKLGISRAIVLGVDHGLDGDLNSRNVSDQFVHEFCSQSPDRLFGIGSIHPDRGSAIESITNTMYDDYGLYGIKLYPHAGFYVDDPLLDPAYDISQTKSKVIFMHAGIKAHSFQRMKFNNPILIDEVAVKYPHLKIVICHCGYPWVDEAILISRSNGNVWLDLTFLETIQNFTHEPVIETVARKVVNQIGCDKVIWGSEGADLGLNLYPDAGLDRIKQSLDNILNLSFLDTECKEKILCKNLERLLEL